MNEAAEMLARHPALVALGFAVLAGWCGLSTFRAGMHYQSIRCAVACRALAASEALGG